MSTVTDAYLERNVEVSKTMGEPMHVKGFAMPYNKANSYNEIVRHGAFTKFLERLGDRPLPMGFMHDGPCGYWTKIEDRPDGLYCEGFVTHPAAKKYFRNGTLGELSISFEQASDPDGHKRFSSKRIEDFHARGLRGKPSWVREVWQDEVTEADLAEISLVDRGAFDGTWVRHA